jgi:excisionase family DNA binding protein
MSAHLRPYSPETLAERWGCSSEKILGMYHAGELAGFRLGKLIRISADEVERYECSNTPSQGIEENSPARPTRADDAYQSRLVRMIGNTPPAP